MQVLISIFFGMVCALAFKRGCNDQGLGYWRLVAGAVVGMFPHLDFLFSIAGYNFALAYQNSILWSFILAPIYASLLAFLLAFLSKKKWQQFIPVTLGVLLLTIFMAILTDKGIQPFAPFSNMVVALNLIYPFDLTIMGISVVALALAVLLTKFRCEIGRVAVVLILCYSLVLVSFYFKARNFAKGYAEAFALEVEEYHIIPQPISSFNWRLVVETTNQRYHDTLVNIFREDEISLDGEDSRTNRIDSLYKPLDKAVWRVYRRYGYKNKAFAKSAWVSMYMSSDQFKWLSRYWVAKDVIHYNGNPCARFMDLRREGSRRAHEGLFIICKENNGAALYRSDDNGSYSLLEMMY